jgi:single-strand DNA-binding protein
MTVNKCILIGNLGKDAEIRATGGGTTIANLRLATTDRRKAADGSWQDHTEWHSVVAFGKTAEIMEKWGKKGKTLYVEGRLQTREYTDKDGNKRWSTEVVANEIRLLGGRSDEARDDGGTTSRTDRPTSGRGGGSDRGGSGGGGGARGSTGREEAPSGGGYDDDSIPF